MDTRPPYDKRGATRDPDALVVPGGATLTADGRPHAAPEATQRERWSDVPWRTIIATIGLVAFAMLLAVVVYIASRIVVWVVIAGFFAAVLSRPVGWFETRYRLRRGVAIGLVVGSTVLLVVGLVTLFILPVRTQLVAALTDLPGTVQQATEGRGPVGNVVSSLHLEQLVLDNQDRLTRTAASVESSLPAIVASAIQIALGIVAVAVMTCLMLSQSKSLGRAAMRVVPFRHRDWIADTTRNAALAISGYMIGNLLISLCAGVAAFLFLFIAGVSSPVVLALWVAFADLIPLVGATLGAIVAVIAAFLVSPTVGIVAIVFFALYQQFENSYLQIAIMSRTVRVNPLVVLLSVLLGVEIFGLAGALLAVPLAGATSVVVKELWRHRPADPNQLVVVGTQRDEDSDESQPSRLRRGLSFLRRRRPNGPQQV